MALKVDVSTSHHLLRSQLCCLETEDVIFRDKSLLPLHQAFFLGGWPGTLLCISEILSLQAVPNKCVRTEYTPTPHKPSPDFTADTQVPISIEPGLTSQTPVQVVSKRHQL